MTPHEKAKELVDKFTVVGLQQRNEGIQCALICVGEIINEINIIEDINPTVYEYWKQVILEIDKL